MIEAIGNLVRYIVLLIFLATLLEMILPQGEFRRYLRMLVGILLIFTLLTPLQKIMRLEPYLEFPALSWEQDVGGELDSILQEGEKRQEENFKAALSDYRSRIFQLLAGELRKNFNQELLRLEAVVEENPENAEFGALQAIHILTRRQEGPGREAMDEKQGRNRISINVFEERGDAGGEIDPKGERIDDVTSAKRQEIRNYLAGYLQLSSENVEVQIIP